MLTDGKAGRARILFAHGAGAPMDSDFMADVAQRLASDDIEVIRFEFPYMQKRREDGKRRPPDRQPKLLEHFQELIATYSQDDVPLYLAGKSMGGRMATMLADLPEVSGCFVFGYPFYAPGKQDKPRTEHLETTTGSVSIFQGTRDPMGKQEVVVITRWLTESKCYWLEDGDHDLKPRKASGLTQQQHLEYAVAQCQQVCLSTSL